MRYLVILAALLVAGCSTTSGGSASESRSGYDGARVVSIPPHGAACTSMLCPGLGAQWNDKRPDVAIITVQLFNEWTPITTARLMIDGKETVLQPSVNGTQFNPVGQGFRNSYRDFTGPLSTLRALSTAQRAWLRVGTSQGTTEVAIVDGSTDSKALHAIRRFLAQVGPQ